MGAAGQPVAVAGVRRPGRHHPDVADVVPAAAAFHVRPVDGGDEPPAGLDVAHVADVVVAERHGVLLDGPPDVDHPQVQVVVRGPLAVRPVVPSPRLELLELLGKADPAHPGHARPRGHRDAVDLVVDGEGAGHRGLIEDQIPAAGGRVRIDLHLQIEPLPGRSGDVEHRDAGTQVDRVGRRRGEVLAMDPNGPGGSRRQRRGMHAGHRRLVAEAFQGDVDAGLVVAAGEPAAADGAPAALDEHHLAQLVGVRVSGNGAAPPLEAGVDDGAAGAFHLPAGVREGVRRLGRELVLGAGHRGDRHPPVDRAPAGRVPAQQPLAADAGRPHRRRPRRPLGRLEREPLRQVGHGPVHRLRLAVPGVAAPERLEVGERVVAPVHRHQQRPLLAGAPLADDAPHRVALRARLLDVRVVVGLVVAAALRLPGRVEGLGGGEAEVVRQVAHHVAGRLRRQGHVVQGDHAADGLLPSLGRRAPERDAREPARVVGLVARAAGLAHRLVVDGNAGTVGLGRLGGGAGRREQRDEGQGEQGLQTRQWHGSTPPNGPL